MKKIILSGSSNIPLAKKIAKQMNTELGNIIIKKFSDGEKYVNVQENVKGKEAIILQSGSIPSDEHVLELFLILDAVKRLKPKKITVVLSFYPYRRQERESEKGDAVSAQVIARLLQANKIDKLVVIDLHSPVIKRFYKIPVKEISTFSLFADYFRKKDIDTVIAPDEGSIARSRKFASYMGLPLLVMKKIRIKHDKVSSLITAYGGVPPKAGKTVSGKNANIAKKNVVMIDDEINTAGTLVENVRLLKKLGTNKMYFAATHAVLSEPAIQRLKKSGLEEIVVTDSIALPPEKKFSQLKVISLSDLITDELTDINIRG